MTPMLARNKKHGKRPRRIMSSGRQQAISDIQYYKHNGKSPMKTLVDAIIDAYVVIGYPGAASDSSLAEKISNIE